MPSRQSFFLINKANIPLRVVGVFWVILLLAGCSSLSTNTNTDYRESVVTERDALSGALADELSRESASVAGLTAGAEVADGAEQTAGPTVSLAQLLDDPQLAALINKSLEANPGLQQTLFTLKQSRSQARMSGAARLPDADLDVSGERTEGSDDSFSSAVSVSWELDLWSKLDDSYSAALAGVAEQEALFQAAQDSLVADVMDAWMNLIQLNRTLWIQQQRVEARDQYLQSTIQRYRTGIGAVDDLDSARSSLASARADLADDEYQLAEARRTLRGLVGVATDDELEALGFALSDQFPAVGMPISELPEQTLERRPDLKAAWHALEAAEFNVDVAYKDMLPSLSLTAAFSDSGTSPSDALFKNPVWSLLGQLSAPLFRGGELKASARQAEYAQAEAAQAYREALLTAVTEVENAVDKEQTLTTRIAAIDEALIGVRDNEARYLLRYRAGLSSLQELLSVRQSRFDLEDSANSLQYQHLTNRISLGLTLGLPGVASPTVNSSENPSAEETLK